MRPSSYCINVEIPDSDKTLLFHGYSGAVDLVQENVVRLLENPQREINGKRTTVSEETLSLLKKRGYVTERSYEEERNFVKELGERVHRVMRKYSGGGFLIIPTYSCNLRCQYCYEKSLRRNGKEWFEKRMDRETADAAFEAMKTIDPTQRKNKSLSFYGGEPFQRENRDIVEHIFWQAKEKGFNMFSAITNGVDLDHYLDLLGPEGKVRFLQITLDGPPEVHDTRRCLADGSGTFFRISENISRALETKTTISVRINVDRKNVEDLAALREFFIAQGWDRYPNFRSYCSPVHGNMSECKEAPAPQSRFKGHLEMQQSIKIEQRPKDEPLDVCSLTASISRNVLAHFKHKGLPRWKTGFCGSNSAMHMLDPHGDMYPCWEVIGHLEHRIGRYGRGFVAIDASEAEKWHNRSVVRIEECVECPYLFFCAGGCEAFAYQKNGSLNSPNCSDYPRMFAAAAVMAYEKFCQENEAANVASECT